MYTATKREITKFMRTIDMETPRTVHRICTLLRDNHKQYWFNEDKVIYALTKLHAETLKIGDNDTLYYYIENWNTKTDNTLVG